MDLLDEALCGSYLTYLPKGRGEGQLEARSRQWCDALKQGKHSRISKIAEHIAHHPGDLGVRKVLGDDVMLVPMPRRAPRRRGDLWPAEPLTKALVAQEMGAQILPILERMYRVRKSATAPRGNRPTAADHLESFKVLLPTVQPERIAIVDDVITTGATMLAAISAVSDAVPEARVRGFAFTRTQSWGNPVTIRSPTLSWIDLRSDGRTRRRP